MENQKTDVKQLHAEMFRWWKDLENHKGERAALRRCAETPSLVRHAKQYVLLANRLGRDDLPASRIMPILGLLSHVKADSTAMIKDRKISIAEAMARSKHSGPIVSELRFQRLLQAKNQDELYPLLLRGIKLLDHTVNISDLITERLSKVNFNHIKPGEIP